MCRRNKPYRGGNAGDRNVGAGQKHPGGFAPHLVVEGEQCGALDLFKGPEQIRFVDMKGVRQGVERKFLCIALPYQLLRGIGQLTPRPRTDLCLNQFRAS